MAKALFGHVGSGSDLRLLSDVTRLRRRVRDLEAEVSRLRLANSALAARVHVNDEVLSMTVPDAVPASIADLDPVDSGAAPALT